MCRRPPPCQPIARLRHWMSALPQPGKGAPVPMTRSEPRSAELHFLAASLLGGIVIVWALALLLTLGTAGAADERSGTLLAVFPRGIAERDVLARVAAADGTVVRGSWFANVWHVHGQDRRFARSLREQGAVWVVPALPYAVFGSGGCGYGLMSPPRS